MIVPNEMRILDENANIFELFANYNLLMNRLQTLETALNAIKDTDGVKKIDLPIDVGDRDDRLLGRVKILDSLGSVVVPATSADIDDVEAILNTTQTKIDEINSKLTDVYDVVWNINSSDGVARIGTPVDIEDKDARILGRTKILDSAGNVITPAKTEDVLDVSTKLTTTNSVLSEIHTNDFGATNQHLSDIKSLLTDIINGQIGTSSIRLNTILNSLISVGGSPMGQLGPNKYVSYVLKAEYISGGDYPGSYFKVIYFNETNSKTFEKVLDFIGGPTGDETKLNLRFTLDNIHFRTLGTNFVPITVHVGYQVPVNNDPNNPTFVFKPVRRFLNISNFDVEDFVFRAERDEMISGYLNPIEVRFYNTSLTQSIDWAISASFKLVKSAADDIVN